MIIVEGWIKYSEGDVKKMHKAIAKAVAATNANEEGCMHYSIASCLSEPDVIRISERWRNQKALEGHFAQPHVTKFMMELAKATRIDADVRAYQANEVRRLI